MRTPIVALTACLFQLGCCVPETPTLPDGGTDGAEEQGAVCGDGVCESPETCGSCAADCGDCCGNGVCEAAESCCTCAGDCGPCGLDCGDGCCGSGETCFSCTADCGSPVAAGGPTPVDMVFVIDDSGSMTEEQINLRAIVPRLIDPLISPPLDAMGMPLYPPIEDLHVGIVSTNLGAGASLPSACASSDDGLFNDRYRILNAADPQYDPSCSASYPRYLSWSAAASAGYPLGAFEHDLGCVAALGRGGCGFEQPLEALYRALTTHLSATGDGLNDIAGEPFLRPDSILAIVILSDENDCSAADTSLFDLARTDLGPANLRCFNNPGYLHPVSRYQAGLSADVLPLHPLGRIVIADFGGIPLDLAGADPATILADPRMVEQVDPAQPTQLIASCSSPGSGVAYPPSRRIELLEPFWATSAATAQSIWRGPVR